MATTMVSFALCVSIIISLGAKCNGLGLRSTVLTEPVATNKGPIVGKIVMAHDPALVYSAFTGIPYAKNPSGHRRFKPPEEVDRWEEPLNVIQESPICKQIDVKTLDIVGVEDCLYLNVYTPQTDFPGEGSYPVMVWIHGGAFRNGDSSITLFRPDSMVKEGVIVVTFNYRLGIFGFLNLHHDDAAGNAGLKDQNLVLKWVQKNIHSFGGDPKRVTIVGDTAGAVSVDLHLISEMSAGLFQQSISMSGSPLCLYWGFEKSLEVEFHAKQLGQSMGIFATSKDELLKNLLEADANEIVRKSKDLTSELPFRPTLEMTNVAKGQEKFMTECAFKKLKEGKFLKGPHITGFALSDAASFSESNSINLNLFLKAVILDNNLILDGSNSFVMDYGPKSFTTLATDILFAFGVDESARLISSENDGHPVYYYRYSEDPMHFIDKSGNYSAPIYYYGYTVDAKHSANMSDDVVLGAYTADSHLSKGPYQENSTPQAGMSLTRRRLIRMWANFIKTGDPTPVGDEDELLGVEWPPVTSDGYYLDINSDLTVYQGRPISGLVETLHLHNVSAKKHDNDCLRAEFVSWETPNHRPELPPVVGSEVDPAGALIEQFENGFQDFKNQASGVLPTIAEGTKKGFAKVQDGLGQAEDYVVDKGKQVAELAKTNVKNKVEEYSNDERAKIKAVLDDERMRLVELGKEKVNKTVENVATKVKDTFNAAADTTSNSFKFLWNTGFNVFEKVGINNALINGAKNLTHGIIDVTANLTKNVANSATDDASTAVKITANEFIDDSAHTAEQLGTNFTDVALQTPVKSLNHVLDNGEGTFKWTVSEVANKSVDIVGSAAHGVIGATGHLARNSIQGYTNVTTNAFKNFEIGAVNETVKQIEKVAPESWSETLIKPGGETITSIIKAAGGDFRDTIGGASRNGIDITVDKLNNKVEKIDSLLKKKIANVLV